MHWSFPLEQVRPLVPSALELDAWDGRAWIGLVPFAMREIRSSWMPRRPSFDFLETNVRTYVHYRGEPGVYFILVNTKTAPSRELASKSLAVLNRMTRK